MSRVTPTRRQVVAALGAVPVLAATRAQEPKRERPQLRATLILLRHAEKSPERSVDPPLSDVGKARARAFARMFGSAGVTTLLHSGYRRTRDTLAPLAEANDIDLEAYDARDLDALVRRISEAKSSETIVVAGHSNTTPAVAWAFGVELPDLDRDHAPEESPHGYLPHDTYDRVHVLTPGELKPRLLELRSEPLGE